MPGASESLEADLPLKVNSLKLDTKKRAADGSQGRLTSIPMKKKKYTPDSELRFNLESCSKMGDIVGALAVYDEATKKERVKLNQYHYNVILYMCSSAALGVLVPGKGSRRNQNGSESNAPESEAGVEDGGIVFRGNMAGLVQRDVKDLLQEVMQLAQKRGLEIYEQMKLEGVAPNEATFTSLARLAVAKRDGDLAFNIVKEMTAAGIVPRLRSYGPALYTYLKNNQVDKAFEVDIHMLAFGVQAEEMELEVLLELSSKAGLENKVYSVLHRLRRIVRDVSPSTVSTIERWFRSDPAAQAGSSKSPLQIEDIRRALELRGGGGHELGWTGKGRWNVEYSLLDKTGVCQICKEKLLSIDIDPQETEKFAERLVALACEKERDTNSFKEFQSWLDEHGPFDAVVDGANVALYNQNFAAGGFSFNQLNSVVSGLQDKHGKLPLVVLHKRRITGGAASAPFAQQLLKQWAGANALYTASTGSNDDWYWLYAAVKFKCLLISNDEMRDHLFQLLGNDFFPQWKERHQVRFEFTNTGLKLHMPPPYSTVIQESEKGAWHIPISTGDDIQTPRRWLCITRLESS